MKRWGTELLLLGVVIVWGINYTFGKYGVIEITSIEFTAIRFLIAAPLLLLITMLVERSIAIRREDYIRLLIVSIVGIVLYQTLFMETIKHISATKASLLISISPIFTAVFSVLFKQEKFSTQKLIGSFIAFAGTALVLLVVDPSNAPKNVIMGTLIGIIASICWGLYPILANPLINKYSALRVTAWSAVIGAIPLCLFSGTNVVITSLHLNQTTWLSLLYSIFFVTIFGLVTWYRGVKKIGATNTMVYMYLTPLSAVFFASLWADEHVYLKQIIGGLIIFIGLWVVRFEKKTPIKKHSTDRKVKRA
jgi:drug/metabolite transporter (DMT)-like permease